MESLIRELSSDFPHLRFRQATHFASISSLSDSEKPDALFIASSRGSVRASALLEEARRIVPGAVRYLLETPEEGPGEGSNVKSAMGANILVPQPWGRDEIRAIIDRQLVFDHLVPSREIRAIIGGLRTFPSIPSVYQEVIRELDSPGASAESVAKIISADMAITLKLIQVVNSAYYGLQQRISDPVQAVFHLGLDEVKSLVLGINSFTRFDKIRPYYYSIDRVWKHSLRVASLAKLIASSEGLSREHVDEAYSSGLLHDIGKLALAVNFSEEYSEVIEICRRDNRPAHEVEKELLGLSHAELGGYLLYLWGLPLSIVEAVGLHHEPSAVVGTEGLEVSPLTAVHVAECLNKNPNAGEIAEENLTLDEKYLEAIGVELNISQWLGGVSKGKEKKEAPGQGVHQPVHAGVNSGSNGGVIAGHALHHKESMKPLLAVAIVGSVILAWIFLG